MTLTKKEAKHKYYLEHRSEILASNSRWARAHPHKYREYNRRAWLKLRREVFAIYGSKCACCGLDDIRFLTIDHATKELAQQDALRGKRGGSDLYCWLRAQGKPVEGYSALCVNCNLAKSWYGICPHQEQVRK